MSRAILALAFLIAAAPVAGHPESDPDSEKAIRQLLASQVTAWNRGDLKGFMAGYWQSPDLTFFSGKDVTKGWQSTLERYQKRYQGEGREMGKLTFRDVEVDVLGPGNAHVRGRWEVVTSKETLSGLYSLLVKKRPEGWRIVHDHTSG